MIEAGQVEKEIDAAINASIELLACLDKNDWESAEIANQKRMALVRLLSKSQGNISLWQKFGAKIKKFKHLDDKIVKQGKDLHSQMLSMMCDNRYKMNGCVQYRQHK